MHACQKYFKVLYSRPAPTLGELGDRVFIAQTAPGSRGSALRVSGMCASEMGTLWHHWSPVLISLAALFSKGEETPPPPPGAPGRTLLGLSVWEGVRGWGWPGEWVWVCVDACARARVRQPRSSAAPLQQVPPGKTWAGGPE